MNGLVILLLATSAAVLAQDDGQYRPELYNQGANDGRYYPGDDGKYVHQGDGDRGQYNGDNGQYVHQGDGDGDRGQYVHQADDPVRYVHQEDDRGKYVHQADDRSKYVHQEDDRGRYNGNNQGAGQGSGGFRPGQGGAGVRPGQGGAGVRPGQGGAGVRPGSGSGAGGAGSGNGGRGNGNRNAGGHGGFEGKYRIIKFDKVQDGEGYNYAYETENKIFGEEQGKLANQGTDDEGLKAHGYFKYTSTDDGVEYRVDYTADENGFLPQASHLPVAPPVPELIQRSLEWLRSQGQL